jgi:hypothetical protein
MPNPPHTTSGAHYLRELLPKVEFWPGMPPTRRPIACANGILEFGRAHHT